MLIKMYPQADIPLVQLSIDNALMYRWPGISKWGELASP